MVILKKSKQASKRSIYKVRTQQNTKGETEVLISKLDGNLDIVATYLIYTDFNGEIICNCPSRKRPCKHIGFVDKFVEANQIGGGLFYDADNDKFIDMDEV